jgi:prolyl-tRNA synthetase
VAPLSQAPYRAVLLAIGDASAPVHAAAASLAAELSAEGPLRGELVLDDRPADQASAGLKMREARLLGFPFMAVLGREFASRGLIELHGRTAAKPQLVTRQQLRDALLAQQPQQSVPK